MILICFFLINHNSNTAVNELSDITDQGLTVILMGVNETLVTHQAASALIVLLINKTVESSEVCERNDTSCRFVFDQQKQTMNRSPYYFKIQPSDVIYI